ncbi:MAG: M23 family metallopeptidase [Actinomycetota bacterium]|nr:M23 family metallopeptidase [Actinomycetota bacterium]
MSAHSRTNGRHRAVTDRPVEPARSRHRITRPPKSRYAAVATTAILGAGVVALGSGASLPSPRPVAAASWQGQDSPVAGIGLGDGVLAPHGTAARYDPRAGFAAPRASRGRSRQPLKYARPGTGRLTSCFCWRWGAFHDGIDLAAPMGAPIYAVADGVVEQAGPDPGYGNLIMIRHDKRTESFYGHEEKILVLPGQRVHAGQLIALVGNLGFSTGPHLHFGIRVDGVPVDPAPWLRRHGLTV